MAPDIDEIEINLTPGMAYAQNLKHRREVYGDQVYFREWQIRTLIRPRAAAISVLGLLSACGGGGFNGASTIPQSNPVGSASASDTRSVQIGLQPTTAQLPVVSQITGTLSFPAVPIITLLELSASATAPSSVSLQSPLRHPSQSSGTLTVYEYFTLVPQTSVTPPSIPAITLKFPSSAPLAGKSVFYGISDLNSQGGVVSFDTQGPGSISGQTVSFTQVPTPITFSAGHKYTFVVYATTTATTATGSLLFAANTGDDSITAYPLSATGNVSPVRTISGGSTLLGKPQSIAVDGSGRLWVLGASGLVTAYAPGANGDVTPVHHFPTPGIFHEPSSAIRVSKDGTKVLVGSLFPVVEPSGALVPLFGVATYDVNGALKSVVVSASTNPCGLDGGFCGGSTTFYRGVAFARDGSIASGYWLPQTPDSQYSGIDDLPSQAPPGLTSPIFNLTSDDDACCVDEHDSTSFSYEPSTNRFAVGVDYYYFPGAGEVHVADFKANASFDQIIGSQNNTRALLDNNISGVALDADGTVYVASTTGYINIYGPKANGDIAPERRIIGTSTMLISPVSLAIYSP